MNSSSPWDEIRLHAHSAPWSIQTVRLPCFPVRDTVSHFIISSGVSVEFHEMKGVAWRYNCDSDISASKSQK